MSKSSILLLTLLAFIIHSLPVTGQSDSPDNKTRKAIFTVISNSIGWAIKKDTALLFSGVVNDSSLFIYHPDSRSTIRGYGMFHDFALKNWLRPGFKALEFKIKELRLNLSLSGEVAWFSCLLDDFCELNGQRTGWENCRWTGVLEKQKGKWVIVQMHFSFPVDQNNNKM